MKDNQGGMVGNETSTAHDDTGYGRQSQRVGLLIIAGDRQLYLFVCLLALLCNASTRFEVNCVVDTSGRGMTAVNRWLAGRVGLQLDVATARHFSQDRAIRLGLSRLAEHSIDVVMSVEEDFILRRRHRIVTALALLEEPGLLQVCLCRQRWFRAEYRYKSMAEYLIQRRKGRRRSDGVIELSGFFTTNPSVASVMTLSQILERVPTTDSYEFEMAIGEEALKAGLRTLVLTGSKDRPLAVHIGAVTTRRLRSRRRWMPSPVLYVMIHAARIAVVTRRHLGISNKVRLTHRPGGDS